MSNRMSALTALINKTQIWFLSHHFLYFWYSWCCSFTWSDFSKFRWTSFINILSALITAFSLSLTLMLLCLDDALCCLNFSTFCKIFIAKIHFSTQSIILLLKDLNSVCSVKWHIIWAVNLIICISDLTRLFLWVTASFQKFITSSHSIALIMQSSFFTLFWHFSWVSSYSHIIAAVRLSHFSSHTSSESKCENDS